MIFYITKKTKNMRIEEEMMGAAQLKVPLSIDIEEGMTLYEAK